MALYKSTYMHTYTYLQNTAVMIDEADLIGAPVPDGYDGETEEYARPWQTSVVSRANEVQRVVRRSAAVQLRAITVSHSTNNSRVG